MKTIKDLIEEYVDDAAEEWGLDPDSIEGLLYWMEQTGKDKILLPENN